jgi:hypothetical protein
MLTDFQKVELIQKARARRVAAEDGEGAIIAGRLGDAPPARAFAGDLQQVPYNAGLFADWRQSKCLPRDYSVPRERLTDLDQGTLELVGETAEVVELLLSVAEDMDEKDIPGSSFREKLIDECGDVFFCLSWLGDAWGCNPLRHPINYTPYSGPGGFQPMLGLAMTLHMQAGLLANSAKKLIYQGREQPIEKQFERLVLVVRDTLGLLHCIGATHHDALARNVEKLEARYPVGTPLSGGGIRVGKGA